jgi:hypothetical protein
VELIDLRFPYLNHSFPFLDQANGGRYLPFRFSRDNDLFPTIAKNSPHINMALSMYVRKQM